MLVDYLRIHVGKPWYNYFRLCGDKSQENRYDPEVVDSCIGLTLKRKEFCSGEITLSSECKRVKETPLEFYSVKLVARLLRYILMLLEYMKINVTAITF